MRTCPVYIRGGALQALFGHFESLENGAGLVHGLFVFARRDGVGDDAHSRVCGCLTPRTGFGFVMPSLVLPTAPGTGAIFPPPPRSGPGT